ncbi:MAG: hypothetical protein KDC95_04990 [Planctomycetes bacterium]|nr:hypothetical protein [Planctomycetota bacterium]
MFDKLFMGLAMMTSSLFYGANLAPETTCDGCEAGYAISGFSGAYGGTFQAWVIASEKGECAVDTEDGECTQASDCDSQVKWVYTPAYPYIGGHRYCWEMHGWTKPYCLGKQYSPHVATAIGSTVSDWECGLAAWDTVWLKNWTTSEEFTIGQIHAFCEYCLNEDQDGE